MRDYLPRVKLPKAISTIMLGYQTRCGSAIFGMAFYYLRPEMGRKFVSRNFAGLRYPDLRSTRSVTHTRYQLSSGLSTAICSSSVPVVMDLPVAVRSKPIDLAPSQVSRRNELGVLYR